MNPQASCVGKVFYASPQEAWAKLCRAAKPKRCYRHTYIKTEPRMVYHCTACGGWHLGRSAE